MRDSFGNLEQVHVTRMNCRSLRLELAVGLAVALAVLVTSTAAKAQTVSTETSMSVTTSDLGGQTNTAVVMTVTAADGLPASGAVTIFDGGQQLAQVALNPSGQATATLTIPGGEHSFRALYSGDSDTSGFDFRFHAGADSSERGA